jgi:hypothetical protein
MYRWLVLVLVAGCDLVFEVEVPDGKIAFVQRNDGSTTDATTEVGFLTDTRRGSLIIVGVDWTGDVTFNGISTSTGEVLEQIGSEAIAGGIHARMFYAADVGGGPWSVTVVLSGPTDSLEIYLSEYAGIARTDPLDAAAVNASDASFDVTSGEALLADAGDLIFAYSVDGSVTPGPGFLARSTFHSNLTMERISGEPGLYAATATATSGWTIHMAAFRRATR